jgi:hypothetical protein
MVTQHQRGAPGDRRAVNVARAQVVVDPTEAKKALRLLILKYPQQASIPLPMHPADVRMFRATPTVST